MPKPKRHRAIGVHVFAGGFTMGMREHLDVQGQMEIHGLGAETVQKRLDLPFIIEPDWHDWMKYDRVWRDCNVVYGNPRCTGFSCTTAGYDEAVHGHSAKCTKDIWDLCYFGTSIPFFDHNGADLIIWESVQHAYTVGRPLLDRLRDEVFAPKGYRICHMFLNAASFGNAQHRKRYFFVAYRGHGPFNILPPQMLERHTTVGDVLSKVNHPGHPTNLCRKDVEYDEYSYQRPQGETGNVIPYLLEGECLNRIGKNRPEVLKKASAKLFETWEDRSSPMPFSMHCLQRLRWDGHCPTMSSSCGQFVHPRENRPLTVGELAALMGWPDDITPLGPKPMFQIAKGICPEVGVWLGLQCRLYLDDYWKDGEDWESSYDRTSGEWYGGDATGKTEKTFHMNEYAPEKPCIREPISQ